jgi:hypothetical protein
MARITLEGPLNCNGSPQPHKAAVSDPWRNCLV